MTTLRAGLIGAHISRTRLPRALELMCDAAKISLEFELIDTANRPDFQFDACVDAVRNSGWTGVTVTHPFKPQAAFYAGAGMVDDVAHLRSANTLVFGKDICGHNTDYTGFLSMWRAIMGDAAPGKVAMAGAGGVAQALGPALQALGCAHLSIWDSQPDRAAQLCQTLGPNCSIAEPAHATSAATGLVNATPLGMAEYPGNAFSSDGLGSQTWAFDAVYTPPETRFLRDATAAGLKTISGFELFKHMAVRSFEAYTDLKPDEGMIDQLDALRPMEVGV
ncbi:shikimate dehydrogenase family protein [Litoreibacter roseus]|uniref:Shikimate dehydrogenase n=1 Tax=Litoreibacter roseus TaxID=2601869 RepID=A0A6N6JGX9_9RHOB|nr:hypothetical protein [Litoreibacter roseus]GFE65476.1 shikimate dehydrogenase [Litoreibacter roseus]